MLLGFVASKCDSSLFVYSNNGVCAYVLIYVDDILITGNSDNIIQDFINKLHLQFALKQLGALEYFHGLEVKYLKMAICCSHNLNIFVIFSFWLT